MDFELTDEQHALEEVIRDLVSRDCPPALVRAVVEGRDDGSSFWETLVANDWPGLTVAAEDGGSGATAVELAITLEQLGWGGDPTPYLATTTQFVPLVQAAATNDQRRALLGAVCEGGTGTVAFAADSVQAQPDGDGWVLRGTANHVFDGDRADQIAVVAAVEGEPDTAGGGGRAGQGMGLFVVRGADVDATRMITFDNSLHLAAVDFGGARVGADDRLAGVDGAGGAHDDVAGAVQGAGEWAVTGLSAVMVGACQRVFDLVLDHVKARKQFDVPIGSFQAVKHMAVDVFVSIQRARALVQFAALTIAEDDPRRHVAPSMAKVAAGDCQRLTARHGIQLFGGLGFTWENDIQLYLKRAKAGELLLHTSAQHRARVARATLADVLGGTAAGDAATENEEVVR